MGFWDFIVNASYFVAAVLFIRPQADGLAARPRAGGIKWAGAGMLVATVVTFLHPAIHGNAWHYILMIAGHRHRRRRRLVHRQERPDDRPCRRW